MLNHVICICQKFSTFSFFKGNVQHLFFYQHFMQITENMISYPDTGGCCRKMILESLPYRFPLHRLFSGFVFHPHMTYHRRKIDPSDSNFLKIMKKFRLFQIIMIWFLFCRFYRYNYFSSVSSAYLRLQQTILHFYLAGECHNWQEEN